MSGEVMLRFLGTAAGIEEKSNRDLAGRQYGRLRVVSELDIETRLCWTGKLMLIFHERGGQQLYLLLLVGV